MYCASAGMLGSHRLPEAIRQIVAGKKYPFCTLTLTLDSFSDASSGVRLHCFGALARPIELEGFVVLGSA